MMTRTLSGVDDTAALAQEMAAEWQAGDIVLLEGPLGVGKTTFVRGALRALGWLDDVRSPTFNLLQVYNVDPPVVHCDLYRVRNAQGIGLEDYLDDHLVFIEWPDRFNLLPHEKCWRIFLSFVSDESTRAIRVQRPSEKTPENDSC